MRCAAVWRGGTPRADSIAAAVRIVAQKGTAPCDLARLSFGLRIESRIGPCWIQNDATIVILLISVGAVPIHRPLPDVSSHVVQTVRVRWIRPDLLRPRRMSWERALVDIGLRLCVVVRR